MTLASFANFLKPLNGGSMIQESDKDQHIDVLAVWRTNNRVTEFFFEHLPGQLWSEKIPGAPQRTIRMVAGHIHNARCMWIKLIGKQYALKTPKRVDRRRVTRSVLLGAFKRSNRGIIELLDAGLNHRGVLNMKVPWANIPSDVLHFLTYLVAHEAHHRGQIVLAARALGHRLPDDVTAGLWQWRQRLQESTRQRMSATPTASRHLRKVDKVSER